MALAMRNGRTDEQTTREDSAAQLLICETLSFAILFDVNTCNGFPGIIIIIPESSAILFILAPISSTRFIYWISPDYTIPTITTDQISSDIKGFEPTVTTHISSLMKKAPTTFLVMSPRAICYDFPM